MLHKASSHYLFNFDPEDCSLELQPTCCYAIYRRYSRFFKWQDIVSHFAYDRSPYLRYRAIASQNMLFSWFNIIVFYQTSRYPYQTDFKYEPNVAACGWLSCLPKLLARGHQDS